MYYKWRGDVVARHKERAGREARGSGSRRSEFNGVALRRILLTRACLEDLRALVELEAECGFGMNYRDQVTMSEFRRSFRETYGIDWATALKAGQHLRRQLAAPTLTRSRSGGGGMTLRERYIAGLKAMGYKEAPTRSKKYVVLGDAERGFYFLGKSGAVRYSHTNAVAGSVPVFESTKRRILANVMPPSA